MSSTVRKSIHEVRRMRYGKRMTLLERWEMDSEVMDGKALSIPRRSSSGEMVSQDVLNFAYDFFHLSKQDVLTLSEDKFKALKELESQFDNLLDLLADKVGYNTGFKKLESLCDEGLGEPLDEMWANSPEGTLVPKYVREYLLSRECDEERIREIFSEGYGDGSFATDFFMEASYAKLGIGD